MDAQLRLVEYLAKALVDNPEQVAVRMAPGADGVVELQVAPDDRGQVIGKKGRTAHAMRTLMTAAATDGRPVTLEIVE